jgi:hypothetical protein
MLTKGQSLDNIKFAGTIGDGKAEDYLPDNKFHYMIENPGVILCASVPSVRRPMM